MALTYGFYNSQNGDRVYDADQFSSFLDGIVYDGVYEAVGDKFYVTSLEDEDLTIQVGAGRAWLKHTWTLNDTNLYLTATAALDVYDRIDAVVLEVDKEIRTNSIKIIEGTPSDSIPARPDLKNEDNIRQYPLAYIYREHGTTTILNTHAGTLETDTESATQCIKFMVGSSALPLCSALALAGIPSGGKTGQILAKSSSESGTVGWYDWNHLPSDNPWYLVDGVTSDNVVAAYKFKSAYSIDYALENLKYTSTSYTLSITSGVTWSSSKGLYLPAVSGGYVDNSNLTAVSDTIYSCAFGYSDLNATDSIDFNGNSLTSAYSSWGVFFTSSKYLLSSAKYIGSTSRVGDGNDGWIYTYYWRQVPACMTVSSSSTEAKAMSKRYASGVLSADWASYKLYYNGVSQSTTNTKIGFSFDTFSGGSSLKRVLTNDGKGNIRPMYITALVFYNCSLTDTQHKQLATQINNIL